MNESELIHFIECPICTIIPRKLKVFGCVNGHQICQHCFDRLPTPKCCPRGRCNFSTPPCRVLVVEQMVDKAKVEVNCESVREGCMVKMKQGVELEEHEKYCEFRRIPCFLCRASVNWNKLIEHMEELHGMLKCKTLPGSRSCICQIHESWYCENIKNKSLKVSCVEMNGKKFIISITKKGQFWYLVVHGLFQPEEAVQYEVTLKVESLLPWEILAVETVFNPSSVLMLKDEVILAGNCLIVSNSQMKKISSYKKESVEFSYVFFKLTINVREVM